MDPIHADRVFHQLPAAVGQNQVLLHAHIGTGQHPSPGLTAGNDDGPVELVERIVGTGGDPLGLFHAELIVLHPGFVYPFEKNAGHMVPVLNAVA